MGPHHLTASAHSLVASPFKSAYVAAKHGLAGLTKTVALELATFGVTANCISPGYVWTPLVERQIPDTMKARNMTREQVIRDVMLAAQPTKEFVDVDQVAALAVFLCSDAAGADYGRQPLDRRGLDGGVKGRRVQRVLNAAGRFSVKAPCPRSGLRSRTANGRCGARTGFPRRASFRRRG